MYVHTSANKGSTDPVVFEIGFVVFFFFYLKKSVEKSKENFLFADTKTSMQ